MGSSAQFTDEDTRLRCEMFDYIALNGPQTVEKLSRVILLSGLETYDLLNHEWFGRETPLKGARYVNAKTR